MTPELLRVASELLDFHRCPNTGRIVHSTKGDDKALCRCGKANPFLPNEHPGTHLKARMAPATIDEYVEQEHWSGVVDRYLKEET